MQSSLYRELTAEELAVIMEKSLGTEVKSSRLLTGGLFNTTYLVSTADCGDVVLRVGPVNRHLLMPFEHHLMEAEAHVYALCKEHGVPASEVLAMDNSKTVIDRDYMIVRYLPSRAMYGVPLESEDKARICRDIGVATARLHEIRAAQFGRIVDVKRGAGFAKWSDCLKNEWNQWRCVAEQTALYTREEYAQMETLLEMATPYLDEITTPVLVHTDLWFGNVLITEEAHPQFVAIIDADRSLWGDPEAEFSMIRWMKKEPVFWEGYGRWLSEDCAGMIRRGIYNLISHLWNSYVYEREYNQPEDAQSERTEALRQMAQLQNI